MPMRVHGSQKGVSLIEVLAALFILSVVGVAILGGVFTSLGTNDVTRTRVAANSLARSELEYVQASVYENATWSYVLPGGNPAWDPAHNSLPTGKGYEGFVIEMRADPISALDPNDPLYGSSAGSNVQKLTAIVTFQGKEVQRVETFRTR